MRGFAVNLVRGDGGCGLRALASWVYLGFRVSGSGLYRG